MTLKKDTKIAVDFISLYCNKKHKTDDKKQLKGYNVTLCPECLDLVQYTIDRRNKCKKDPKPACKNCDTPCYAPKYRNKIKEVMRFSGIAFIKRGRIDYLYHYFR